MSKLIQILKKKVNKMTFKILRQKSNTLRKKNDQGRQIQFRNNSLR